MIDTRDIQVRPYASGDAAAWNEYVGQHPGGTFFHEPAWRQAVARAFGHRSHDLVARRGDQVCGVLPLFEIHSLLTGRFLISQPYATYGGVLADDAAAGDALLAEARALMRRLGARCLELRSERPAAPLHPVRDTHVTFVKELPADSDSLTAATPRKARAAARRAAETHDLLFDTHASWLPAVWRLYARSMRRLGSINYPYRFFEELLHAAGERAVVQVVLRRGRPVAGLVSFRHRERLMPYFAGTDDRQEIYGLNNYLYLESMRWGVRHGYRRYDFGRTRIDNAGSYNFKRFCGFEPAPLGYQVFVDEGRSAPDLSPASARWSAARMIWKTLPLPITRPLGGWVARSIPG